MPLADGATFAGYTIVRRLGSGGMGEVYLAQHPRLPRRDALKVLRSDVSADPAYQERFNREADLAAKLWHPHIVGIHDRGKDDDQLWISMDFVDGTDLSHLLRERYPQGMPPQNAVEIVKAIASALDYAHGTGLLHRDVKPANILIANLANSERRILLADFGVARDIGDNGETNLTRTNMTVGTAAYAAPEQLMGRRLDGRADQYALAATAFHLLTGTQPFNDSNQAVVIGKHLTAPPPAVSRIRPELLALDGVLMRGMAKEPAARFATCMDFARALENPQSQRTEPITPPQYSAPPTAMAPSLPPTAMAPSLSAPPTAMAPPIPPPSHPPAQPPSGPSKGRIAAMAIGATAIIITVALVAFFAFKPDPAKPAEPFTLSGTVHLASADVTMNGASRGYECVGAGEFADVGPRTAITVKNESGTVLGKGTISESTSQRDGCDLAFTVADVPAGAKFYRVQVGRHGESSFTEAEAKSDVAVDLSTPGATTTTSPPTTPRPQDPEQIAGAQLQSLADGDRAIVAGELADRWIPQISSKRVGLVAEGTTWNNQAILAEHQRLRGMYPDVKLLWSGDWLTFDGRDFWVTVVGLHSDNPDDVLAWCLQERFDRDHCVAKLVSTTHPIAGSTKFNP
jgi:serine/threonine protein kinase